MAKFGEWIPVKWRPLTEEEKELYNDIDITHMADFETPEDGDEILISQHNGKWVSLVVFCSDPDYGIGDESGNDWLDEVDAWMPLPKGYSSGENFAHIDHKRAIELLKIERECIDRNNENAVLCDRNCEKCDLVQSSEELLEMYDYVINLLKEQK